MNYCNRGWLGYFSLLAGLSALVLALQSWSLVWLAVGICLLVAAVFLIHPKANSWLVALAVRQYEKTLPKS